MHSTQRSRVGGASTITNVSTAHSHSTQLHNDERSVQAVARLTVFAEIDSLCACSVRIQSIDVDAVQVRCSSAWWHQLSLSLREHKEGALFFSFRFVFVFCEKCFAAPYALHRMHAERVQAAVHGA
jgi:hypothetical protein